VTRCAVHTPLTHGIEHLPEETPESAARGIRAFAVGVVRRERSQGGFGEEHAEAGFHLGEHALADLS